MLKKITLLLFALFLSACSTSANNLVRISPGMSKDEVINILGTPESVNASGNREFFIYTLSNSWNSPLWNEKYGVQFVNGRVVSYGK